MANNNDLLNKLNEVLVTIPPDLAAETIEFLRKWLPVIVQMNANELQTLVNHIRAKENRRAMAQLLEKGIELNSSKYLLTEASTLINEWKAGADYNSQLHQMVKEGAEVGLQIIATILVAAL